MSEAEAIEGAKQGDGKCFEALYDFQKKRVYLLCLRMIGNVEVAEDLTQETFLQLYRKIGSFRGESAFSTWLHRLAVNVVLMHLRKKEVLEVSLEASLEATEDSVAQKEFGSEDQVLASSVDRVNIERAIDGLLPAVASFLYCMTWKDTSTTKLPRYWDALWATANRSFSRRV
jgi:RNA polymerase sigma-70 factor (ECF subfamily)